MVYDDAQFLGRLASWDASESSLLLRTDGVSKCIHQGHQDSLPIATWQRKAYPSNWMILNDSILLSSHWVRLRFSNGYQSHQEELVQYGIFFLVCNLKSGNSSSEERPNQLTWGLALPFRIHSPQFQASKECAEVQGSTESAVAERRARLDWPVKSSSVACFFLRFFITTHEMYSGQQGCWKLFAELFLGLRVPQMGPRLPEFQR